MARRRTARSRMLRIGLLLLWLGEWPLDVAHALRPPPSHRGSAASAAQRLASVPWRLAPAFDGPSPNRTARPIHWAERQSRARPRRRGRRSAAVAFQIADTFENRQSANRTRRGQHPFSGLAADVRFSRFFGMNCGSSAGVIAKGCGDDMPFQCDADQLATNGCCEYTETTDVTSCEALCRHDPACSGFVATTLPEHAGYRCGFQAFPLDT